MQRQRPLGVTIVAILLFLGAVLSLHSFGTVIRLSQQFDVPSEDFYSHGVDIALSFAEMFAAFGLWIGNKWAWRTAVSLMMVSIAFDILKILEGDYSLVALFIGTGTYIAIFELIISSVVLIYLFRSHVRDYFRGPLPETPRT